MQSRHSHRMWSSWDGPIYKLPGIGKCHESCPPIRQAGRHDVQLLNRLTEHAPQLQLRLFLYKPNVRVVVQNGWLVGWLIGFNFTKQLLVSATSQSRTADNRAHTSVFQRAAKSLHTQCWPAQHCYCPRRGTERTTLRSAGQRTTNWATDMAKPGDWRRGTKKEDSNAAQTSLQVRSCWMHTSSSPPLHLLLSYRGRFVQNDDSRVCVAAINYLACDVLSSRGKSTWESVRTSSRWLTSERQFAWKCEQFQLLEQPDCRSLPGKEETTDASEGNRSVF